jgi:hypothetical protein
VTRSDRLSATPQSVADILDRAADLIEPEGAWTQGTWARSPTGRSCSPYDDSAQCYCMRGAIVRVGGFGLMDELPSINSKLDFSSAARMARWNDFEDRTQAEVVAKLREAAAKARSEGTEA